MQTYRVINLRSGKVEAEGLSLEEAQSFHGDDFGHHYKIEREK